MTRIGIIGLGEAGTAIHLPALRGIADVAIAGGADPDPARRGAVATRWRIPVFASVDEMLDRTRPDLVVVASPPQAHAAHCLAAAQAGAHVLCEKPFAASVREGETVLAGVSASGCQAAVNHEFRAMPVFRELTRRVLAAGGPRMVQVWQLIDHDPAAERGWRGSLRRRTLYEAGVHLVDLILQFFGHLPRLVRATMAGSAGPGPAEDAVALVTLEFDGGRLAQIVQSRVHRGDRQYLEVRADTARESFRASFGGRARVGVGLLRSNRPSLTLEWGASGLGWCEQGARRAIVARNGPAPLVTATRSVLQSITAALRSHAPVPFPAADGVAALRVIAAAYLAAQMGRAIALDGPDRDLYSVLPLAAADPR